MKKVIKKIFIVIIFLVILGTVFFLIDKNQMMKGKKPIFCYDNSGGSGFIYYGLGYVFEGSYEGPDRRTRKCKSSYFNWMDITRNVRF